jgi:predicted 3-demethylubiquinone-9 3-methyltransferase (glyoxalase superfamily)
MKKITPCLWLDSGAEDAANFYVSVFPNSKILQTEKYLSETPSNKPVGSVVTVTIDLDGNEFMLLNGGPYFKITEAVSFIIPCDDQKEMDYYYDKLSVDPESEVCGWLKDKYGVSWQLLPTEYEKIMSTSDEATKKRVWDKMMNMKRLNLAELLS